LPLYWAQKYAIKIIPLNIHLHDNVFQEGIDLTNSDYYDLLRKEPIFPLTSQPSAGQFSEIFKNLQAGDEALVILISSLLSGTVQSALMAKAMLDNNAIKIDVIDSRSSTIGLGFQVIKACELMAQGEEVDKIKQELVKLQQKLKLYFVVDDLEYLFRGGRINHFSKYIANFLQIKPVLCVENGKIEVFEKIRTKKKAVNRIIGELRKNLDKIEKAAITHVDSPDEAAYLHEEIKKFYLEDIPIIETGPVIGTHVGPGTIGLGFY
jgi:DegV family protein with EDD domain